MNKATTVLLCGVGGQGTILAADLLAHAACQAGLTGAQRLGAIDGLGKTQCQGFAPHPGRAGKEVGVAHFLVGNMLLQQVGGPFVSNQIPRHGLILAHSARREMR